MEATHPPASHLNMASLGVRASCCVLRVAGQGSGCWGLGIQVQLLGFSTGLQDSCGRWRLGFNKLTSLWRCGRSTVRLQLRGPES